MKRCLLATAIRYRIRESFPTKSQKEKSMVSKILSATVVGLEAKEVDVEVHFAKGKSRFFIVGLPDKACSESKERVSAMVRNYLGHRLPAGTFTVNLGPADILKSGPVYDMPIAIGMLNIIGQVEFDTLGKLFFGEMGLDGKTRFTNAILPIADLVRKNSIKELYVPCANAKEAAIIPGINVYPVKDIFQLVNHLLGSMKIKKISRSSFKTKTKIVKGLVDMKHIKGQSQAKRALEIAACGRHNILMSGSPGAGKTMLAKALPSVLPALTTDESLEVTRIYSVSGMLEEENGLKTICPLRKPHHTISHVAMVGGGTIPRPGEISLAHRGVLFLDEFTEFSAKTLEALRQPLEDGVITISRAKKTLTFPAQLMLVAAMNPCKCGWLGDEKKECKCTPSEIIRYKKKISGPILDRIDLLVNVKRVEFKKLKSTRKEENSKSVKHRIRKARSVQFKRFAKSKTMFNSNMNQKQIEDFVKLDKKSKKLLQKAVEVMNFSARSYFKILKVSRTIADLDLSSEVESRHVAEALSFRVSEIY